MVANGPVIRAHQVQFFHDKFFGVFADSFTQHAKEARGRNQVDFADALGQGGIKLGTQFSGKGFFLVAMGFALMPHGMPAIGCLAPASTWAVAGQVTIAGATSRVLKVLPVIKIARLGVSRQKTGMSAVGNQHKNSHTGNLLPLCRENKQTTG